MIMTRRGILIVMRGSYRFVPAIFFMALIFWFSAMPADEVMRAADPLFKQAPTIQVGKPVTIPWLKVGHFIGYAGLGASLLYGLRGRARRAVLAALAITLLYAITDEFHQVYTPGRHAGVDDVLLDTIAACIAILVWEIT